MDRFVIYAIYGHDKTYVGSTACGLQHRKKEHLCELRRNKHINKRLQNFYNKHGEESLIFEVLCIVKYENELLLWEQYFIDLLNPWFNICRVAGSSRGRKHTEESKAKLKLARNKRPPISEETRQRMRNSQKGKSIGRRATQETIEKLRVSHLGQKLTDEQKEKLRQSLLGRPVSQETRDKIANAQRGKHRPKHTQEQIEKIRKAHLGKTLSDETKLKISNAHKGRKHTEESKRKMSEYRKGKPWSEYRRLAIPQTNAQNTSEEQII